jgi:hypothetical protein
MNCEQKYNEALERARTEYEKHESLFNGFHEMLSYIFPELKESEDEKTVKELIQFIKNWKNPNNIGRLHDFPMLTRNVEQCDKYIAWLEKIGEHLKFCKTIQVGDRVTRNEGGVLVNMSQLHRIAKPSNKLQGKSALEAIKEEKVDNTNNVEPKFKVGDWIVNNITKDVFLIKSFNSGYCTLEDVKGNIISPCLPPCESESHLWSIEDAKDGDVLVASDGSIFLFKGAVGRACKHYVALTADSVVVINEGLEHFWETSTAVHPATKEQCDTLMKAMIDAEYTFDFEKKELKELKKIEQK